MRTMLRGRTELNRWIQGIKWERRWAPHTGETSEGILLRKRERRASRCVPEEPPGRKPQCRHPDGRSARKPAEPGSGPGLLCRRWSAPNVGSWSQTGAQRAGPATGKRASETQTEQTCPSWPQQHYRWGTGATGRTERLESKVLPATLGARAPR